MLQLTTHHLSLAIVISMLAAPVAAVAQEQEAPAAEAAEAPTSPDGVEAPPSEGAPVEGEESPAAQAPAATGPTTSASAGTASAAPTAASAGTSETTFVPPPEETAAAEPATTATDDSSGTFAFSGVRLGASLGGGFFVGSVSGGMGGIGAGIGAQFGPLGFMYKFHFFAGYFESGGFGDNFYAAWNTIIADYQFLRIFTVGIGPSVDFVWNCAVQACRDTGPYFGLEARFSVKLGPIKVGLGIHPTFFAEGALNTMFLYFGL